jgi:hypothetical protein
MVDAAGGAVKPAAAALRERRPRKGSHWVEVGGPTIGDCPVSYWKRSGVTVISTLELAALPGQPDRIGLQWHVSASYKADRPSAEHVRRALRDFGMPGAALDNHEPGIAQHYWLVVDPADRRDCDCKESEAVLVEPDGYTWTNPHDSAECRGCAYEASTGIRRCPLHSSAGVLAP